MATGKSYFIRQNNRFLSGADRNPSSISPDSSFELDESDFYSSTRSNSPEFSKLVPSSRFVKKSIKRVDSHDRIGGNPSSLPINVPDWSKILKDEYRDSRMIDSDDDGDDDDEFDGGVRVPPHEFLARQMARTRTVSFSVHEGIGRTLKGRDLSRVRNAIWEKTGFQD